jgi:hypothetical protein
VNLQKATTNDNVGLTLAEDTTITNPVYLFEWQNDQTKVKYYAICQDVSLAGPARERSNLFNITLGVDDPLNSSLILGNVGRYHYFIYEQTSTTNLDPSLSDNTTPISRGTCNVFDDEVSQYNAHQITITYTAHVPTL